MSLEAEFMTMRAVLQRASSTDGYGGPLAGQPQTINPSAKCRIYTKNDRQIASGGKVLQLEEVRGIFAADEDIKSGDIIATVADRSGNEIIAGPLYVNVVVPRTIESTIDHLEVTLKRSR